MVFYKYHEVDEEYRVLGLSEDVRYAWPIRYTLGYKLYANGGSYKAQGSWHE